MDETIKINENVRMTKENNIYTIHFKYPSYELINSIIKTRIVIGGSTDEKYQSIRFVADSVKTLKNFQDDNKKLRGKKNLSVANIAKMIRSLTVQLKYLIESELSTIIGYNPEEIIVINNEKYVFLGTEMVANIDSDMVMISRPYSSLEFFFSPELLRMNEIPYFIHYKTSYFSLALLIIYSLLGDDDFYLDYLNHKQTEKILSVLNSHPIKNTRIFWLLSRCLDEECDNRSIILL